MADIITLATAVTVTGTGGTSTKQAITEAVDVSGYDSLDLQIACLGVNGVNGIKVTVLTSMQNKNDDSSWVSVGQSGTMASAPAWQQLTVPASGTNPLLRYVRYQVDFNAGVTSGAISITGMARRNA